MENKEFKKLLTVPEVSQYLNIPLKSVYYLTETGKIKGIKIGKHWRYHQRDIEKYYTYGTDKGNLTDVDLYPEQEKPAVSDRRTFPRISSNLKCKYSINLPPFKVINSEGIIKNINAGGILLVNQGKEINKIDKDDPIQLRFLLIHDDNQRVNIAVKGKVVRKIQNSIGIKFRNLDENIQNKIMEYAE